MKKGSPSLNCIPGQWVPSPVSRKPLAASYRICLLLDSSTNTVPQQSFFFCPWFHIDTGQVKLTKWHFCLHRPFIPMEDKTRPTKCREMRSWETATGTRAASEAVTVTEGGPCSPASASLLAVYYGIMTNGFSRFWIHPLPPPHRPLACFSWWLPHFLFSFFPKVSFYPRKAHCPSPTERHQLVSPRYTC